MESSKTALVANLGTTAEPVIKAIETAAAEGPLTVFLAYGRAVSDQERTPFSVAGSVTERAKQLSVSCRTSELDTPEEFDGSFKFYQRLVDEVERDMPERVIVDVTGGTKVMAAALVHAALTQQWNTEVIFEYVGGVRDETGRVGRSHGSEKGWRYHYAGAHGRRSRQHPATRVGPRRFSGRESAATW